jgi:LysR family hydrogen peroxide-inducible transcriptional activator
MLTDVGERVVAQAERVLLEVNQLQTIADQYRDPFGGEFRLGIIPTVAPYLLPRILGPIAVALPNLRVKLTEAQTATVTKLLRSGELDAVILAVPTEEEHVTERFLYCEPFYFAVGKDHPKASRQSVLESDLEDESVLLLEDGHCLRDQALAICQSHHVVENTSFRATSLETLRQMVAAGAGVTLMPELAVGGRAGAVRYIPFRGKSPPHRDVGLCWRTSSTRTALLDKLATVLREAVG